MAKKFIIQCPNCNLSHEASTGFFSARRIKCSCGNVIKVADERFVVRECPHCGSSVMYDKSLGNEATCIVCGNKINDEVSKYVEVTCPTCSCHLEVKPEDKTHVCEVCGEKLDVQQLIGKQTILGKEEPVLVQYDGDPNSYAWKHPVSNFPMGSQLVVRESQVALFVKNGQIKDVFGAGTYLLQEDTLPELLKGEKLTADEHTILQSEVYFVNTNVHTAIKWGTDSKVKMFDPASGLHVELGAFGQFNIKVVDAKKFLVNLIGTAGAVALNQLSSDNINDPSAVVGKFKALVITKVKSCLAKAIRENNINILEVDEHLDEISLYVCGEINSALNSYGLVMVEFFISSIATPDDDPNFKRLKQQYADQYLLVKQENIKQATAVAAQGHIIVEAQTNAQVKIIAAQAEAEAKRLQAQAEAAEMQMKGYTYQDETARQVAVGFVENGQGGILGEVAGIGATIGVAGAVQNTVMGAVNGIPAQPSTSTWDCVCGAKGITGNFCTNCGAKRPAPVVVWDCECGQKGITGKFCSNCGKKNPALDVWDCACGNKGIKGNFCSNCGAKKPE